MLIRYINFYEQDSQNKVHIGGQRVERGMKNLKDWERELRKRLAYAAKSKGLDPIHDTLSNL